MPNRFFPVGFLAWLAKFSKKESNTFSAVLLVRRNLVSMIMASFIVARNVETFSKSDVLRIYPVQNPCVPLLHSASGNTSTCFPYGTKVTLFLSRKVVPLSSNVAISRHYSESSRCTLNSKGLNPTGSFKDRGMTVGVSKAKELGYKIAMCASTGNTSASLAAYAAKAQMKCIVLVPKGKIALGKMAQAIAYGAEIYQVDGNFDDSLRVASEICERDNKILLLNSLNPFRIEGQKTVSFEIVEQLGSIPDFVVLPVGNGGNISAVWKGFSEIFEDWTWRIFRKSSRENSAQDGRRASQMEHAPIVHAFHQG